MAIVFIVLIFAANGYGLWQTRHWPGPGRSPVRWLMTLNSWLALGILLAIRYGGN